MSSHKAVWLLSFPGFGSLMILLIAFIFGQQLPEHLGRWVFGFYTGWFVTSIPIGIHVLFKLRRAPMAMWSKLVLGMVNLAGVTWGAYYFAVGFLIPYY